MASPTLPHIVSSSEYLSGGAALSHTVTAPASISDDHVLVAFCQSDSDGNPMREWTAPDSSWERIRMGLDWAATTHDEHFAVFWKRAASESGDYTFGLTNSSDAAINIVNVYGCVTTGNPVGAIAVGADQGTTPTLHGLQVLEDNTLALGYAGNGDGDIGGTVPSGYTLVDAGSVDAGSPSYALVYQSLDTAQSLPDASWSGAGNEADVTCHLVLLSERTVDVPVIKTTHSDYQTTGSSSNYDLPPNVNEGDPLIYLLAVSGGTSVTTPTGWSQDATVTLSSTVNLVALTKIADSGDVTTDAGDQTVTISFGTTCAAVGICLCIDKDTVDTTSPAMAIDVVGSDNTGTSVTPQASGITTNNNYDLVLAVAAAAASNGQTDGTSFPSGYMPIMGPLQAVTSAPQIFVAYNINAAAGSPSTSDADFSLSSSTGWAAVQLSVPSIATVSTLEQEGYRWRNDDGSESAATWKEDQDTATTVAKETTIRLRTLIKATGDPATGAATLQVRRVGDPDSEWRDV